MQFQTGLVKPESPLTVCFFFHFSLLYDDVFNDMWLYRSVYLYISNCYDELNMLGPIVNKCSALWYCLQLKFCIELYLKYTVILQYVKKNLIN